MCDGNVMEHCRSSCGQACHICALNLILITLISIAVCVPAISSTLSLLLCLFISAFITIRMMHFVMEKPLPIYSEELICNSSEYTLDATAYWLGFRKVPIIGNYVGVSVNFVKFHMIMNCDLSSKSLYAAIQFNLPHHQCLQT
ncbi:unnamed protein product [Onchocerca flexuosa]|uniref:Transmembrane protein n=1 Tax=Onchocerca flexuosa TaxID=387005 RepID=A0A183HDV7_9BILA|nr:unnamed protein product [Onchocerca flexuosa]